MLLSFFIHLREHRVPVSIRELLDLLAAMRARLVFADLDAFYFLSRLCLVKDEKYYDRFDVAFDTFFRGLDAWEGAFEDVRSQELLKQTIAALFPHLAELDLSRLHKEYKTALDQSRRSDERERSDNTGKGKQGNSRTAQEGEAVSEGPEGEEWKPDLGERNRIERDRAEGDGDGEPGDGEEGEGGEEGEDGDGDDGERGEGEGGEEGEGTDGQSGVGSGEEPGDGIRDDSGDLSHRSATKVWQLREFADYDPEVELGTRNMKLALRRLRRFARTSAELELDLGGTIESTARNGGILDIREIPERHNAIKVLLFLDVGGSMDDHVELCAQLFSAARSEFKYLEYFYFHNFIYESVWRDNARRSDERVPTLDVLNKFGSDCKVIYVGDASMGRHEIAERGGSVEHYNAETGEAWLARFQERFRKFIWLNPVSPGLWQDVYTIQMVRRLVDGHMYHLSVAGIEEAMRYLAK